LRLRPGEHQRAAKPVHSFALFHPPQSGLAGREHHQLGAAQIKLRSLGRGENTIVAVAGAPRVGPARASPERSSGFSPSGSGGVSALKLTSWTAAAATCWSLRKNP
jgi:hypothetical protein